ncbi:MAG TPA: hypothetical protein GX697_06290 [Firmicutes bacterium]|nr:hypothetical protein [Bacillota bacterium]
MVVVVIIGILVAIAIPIYNSTQERAKLKACQANMRTIEGAAAIFFSESGVWPSDASVQPGGLATTQSVGSESYGPFLQAAPTCPDGGTYSWDTTTKGKVNCSITEHVHY